ncbi:MAG: MBL fold metallo-hydrolase [Deltaproteobacteria bacterium]|nr:MBL fold metallo-hydrolase [Deltaproteobacteria bacterium]
MRNFAYLFGCEKSRVAAVVDPGFEVEKILDLSRADEYRIGYIFISHGHGDHICGCRKMIDVTSARVVAHRAEVEGLRQAGLPVDLAVDENDVVKVGDVSVRVLHTPGHTPGGLCLLLDGEKLITGDTLFVGDCGRVDLPGGDGKALYDSIQGKLMLLDDAVEVWPGHDYGERPSSTIGKEKKGNAAMTCRSFEEFMALP